MPATAESVASETRELAVTRFLLGKGAPVVAPLSSMPAEPYIAEGMTVTLWPQIAHQKADYADEDAMARAAHALRCVHDALATYPGDLPSYKSTIEECAAQLRDQSLLPALAHEDREFLIRAYERLTSSLATLDVHESLIHGDAHLGNVFFTANGVLWTGFEASSVEPREWDASGVPHLPAFPGIDMQVFALMADLRSLCVSVWCWALAAEPDKYAAAKYHLERLRGRRNSNPHF